MGQMVIEILISHFLRVPLAVTKKVKFSIISFTPEKILRAIPRERQTMLFSATMTAKVKKLQRAALKNPVKISINSKYKTVDKNIQKYMFIPEAHKECYLVSLLN